VVFLTLILRKLYVHTLNAPHSECHLFEVQQLEEIRKEKQNSLFGSKI